VSSLVFLAGVEGDKPSFASVLKSQISELRKQLDKNPHLLCSTNYHSQQRGPPLPSSCSDSRDIRVLLDALSDSISKSSKIFDTSASSPAPHSISRLPEGNRDIRVLLDALSDAVEKSNVIPTRIFDTQQSPSETFNDTKNFKVLLDNLSAYNPRNGIGSSNAPIFTSHINMAKTQSVPSSGSQGMTIPDMFRDDVKRFNPSALSASTCREVSSGNPLSHRPRDEHKCGDQ
jgi:hypothetical protein